MIVTFCGHSRFNYNDEIKTKLLGLLEKEIGDEYVSFYLGGYGDFDELARAVCVEYQKLHRDSRLVFVSPYLDENYLKLRRDYLKLYDETIYAEVENVPKKFAILSRNKFMVERADLVISYVMFDFGGAAKTLQFARRSRARLINLAEM